MGIFSRKPQAIKPRARTESAKLIRSAFGNLNNGLYQKYAPILSRRDQYRNLIQYLPAVKNLSRYLRENDAIGNKYIELCGVYVVGEEGFRLVPAVKKSDGSLDTETNATIKKAWQKWSDEASYDGRYSWIDIEHQAIREMATDGEVIYRIVRGKQTNPFGFSLEWIDSHFLDIQYNTTNSTTGNEVVMGIEYDKVTTRPVTYYFRFETVDKIVRKAIDASDIIHIHDSNSPRGIPWMTCVAETLLQLKDYSTAHLTAAQIAAAAPLILQDKEMVIDSHPEWSGATNADEPAPVPQLDLDYSQVVTIPKHQELKALDLQFPQQQYDSVQRAYLLKVASGLFVAYSSLVPDFSGETYSSAKMGGSDMRAHWKTVQAFLARSLHKRVYRSWLEASILSGQLQFNIGDIERLYDVSWIGTGWPSIDPLKDVKATAESIKYGFDNFEAATAKMNGGDWKENERKNAELLQFASDLGLVIPDATAPVDNQLEELKEQVQELQNKINGDKQ